RGGRRPDALLCPGEGARAHGERRAGSQARCGAVGATHRNRRASTATCGGAGNPVATDRSRRDALTENRGQTPLSLRKRLISVIIPSPLAPPAADGEATRRPTPAGSPAVRMPPNRP